MSTHLVGFSRDATVQLTSVPIFHARCEVSAVPEEGVSIAGPHFACRKGAPSRSLEECEACPRFRGVHHGATADDVAVRCEWAERDPVHTVMTDVRALVTVSPATAWSAADELAQRHAVHHLPVLTEGRLVGLVSRSDFFPRPAPDTLVSALMTTDLLAINHAATLAEAVAALSIFKIGCLPVLADGGWLAGILTRGDLVRIGVPREALAMQRCSICAGAHGVRTRTYGMEIARCVACIDAGRAAPFSIVVLGEPE